MKIVTLRKVLCTLSVGLMLLAGTYVPAEAQRRWRDNDNWRARNYGQLVSSRRHRRNRLRRSLRRHQQLERFYLNARLRRQRHRFDDGRNWSLYQRRQRRALRLHQRGEWSGFKQTWKNNGRGHGRGRGRRWR